MLCVCMCALVFCVLRRVCLFSEGRGRGERRNIWPRSSQSSQLCVGHGGLGGLVSIGRRWLAFSTIRGLSVDAGLWGLGPLWLQGGHRHQGVSLVLFIHLEVLVGLWTHTHMSRTWAPSYCCDRNRYLLLLWLKGSIKEHFGSPRESNDVMPKLHNHQLNHGISAGITLEHLNA